MINSSKNSRIGWMICESANEPVEKARIIETNGRRVVGEGIIQRANSKNRNGRFYDDKDLFPQLTCPRTRELLKTGFGSENGHPLSKELVRQQTIDPNNVVAYFTKLWTDGDFIWAQFIGSNLPIGEAFDQDLRDGRLPAWSLRALGTVVNTGRGAEVKDVKVITWDRVYYPSHPEAYTKGIVSESGILLPDSMTPKTPMPASNESHEMLESGILTPIMNSQVLDMLAHESANFNIMKETYEIFYDNIELIDEGSRIQLSDKYNGNVYIVQLENYVQNELRDLCSR